MSKFGEKLTVRAPAKVNLHLAVKDRRPDGFHDLESVFLALDFGDTLHFEPLAGKNALEIAGMSLPVEKNIIFKAVSLFRDRTGFDQGLRISVEKRIPLGSGMGGGPSDAASTLLALNKLAEGAVPVLSRDALLEMAASLGSDVPFFVSGARAAWVTGRGEVIKPVEPPPRCFIVLVNPGFPSETAAAFRLLDDYRSSNSSFLIPHSSFSLTGNPETWPFRNDFLPVFEDHEKTVYTEILSQLRELGAGFVGLSGAGSTCFGVFTGKAQAAKAAEALLKWWNFVQFTFPVN